MGPEPEELPEETVASQVINSVGKALSSLAGYTGKPKRASTLSRARRRTFGKPGVRKAVKAKAFKWRIPTVPGRPYLKRVQHKPPSTVGRRPVKLNEIVIVPNTGQLRTVLKMRYVTWADNV